jgi:hypothetical protein
LLLFRTEVENCAGPAGEKGVAGKQKQTDISHQEQQLKALKIILKILGPRLKTAKCIMRLANRTTLAATL